MSQASKLNRHLAGWRRGQPKPQPIVRTERGKAAPRFINIPQRVRAQFDASGPPFAGLGKKCPNPCGRPCCRPDQA